MSLVFPPDQVLFERDGQLARLGEVLGDAAQGHGHLVAVLGDAGIGKTSLTESFIKIAEKSGARLLYGACEDLAVPEPLGPIHDLARDLDIDITEELNAKGSRLAIYSQLLSAATASSEVSLIVIEDIHWADEATLDFLRYLGRRVKRERAIVLVTGRTDSQTARENVSRVCASVPSHQILRLELAPLSLQTVSSMADKTGHTAKDIYDMTRGNPLYVSEILHHAPGAQVPATIQDSVAMRCHALTGGARRTLEAIAIFPARVEMDTVLSLLPESADAQLDQVLASGLVRTDADWIWFSHEIVRHAVESTLSVLDRRDLNTRAFRLLREKHPDRISHYIHHAREAGEDTAVHELAPQAARTAASLGARREAVEHYALALRCETLPTQEMAALYQEYARELALLERVDEALAAQTRALDLFRSTGNRLNIAKALRFLSRIEFPVGQVTLSLAHSNEALTMLEDSDTIDLAWARANAAHTAVMQFDTDTATSYFTAAYETAKAHNDTELMSYIHSTNVLDTYENPTQGEAIYVSSMQKAHNSGAHYQIARLHTNYGVLRASFLSDYRAAKAEFEAGMAHCMEWEFKTYYCYMGDWLAEVLLRLGEWDKVEAQAREALSHTTAWLNARHGASIALAQLFTRCGNPEAETWVNALQGEELFASGIRQFAPVASILAERAWLGLLPMDQGIAALEKALALPGPDWTKSDVLFWYRKLVPDAPTREIAPMHSPHGKLLAGDWRAAADGWAAIGAPYEQALVLLEGTQDAKRDALVILDDLGATTTAAHVRRMLRAHGMRNIPRGPNPTTRSNSAGLTKRQMDVLQQIEAGLSNADIADNLFVSVKTVDHHVSAILEKLDASNRGEAVARARTLKLLG